MRSRVYPCKSRLRPHVIHKMSGISFEHRVRGFSGRCQFVEMMMCSFASLIRRLTGAARRSFRNISRPHEAKFSHAAQNDERRFLKVSPDSRASGRASHDAFRTHLNSEKIKYGISFIWKKWPAAAWWRTAQTGRFSGTQPQRRRACETRGKEIILGKSDRVFQRREHFPGTNPAQRTFAGQWLGFDFAETAASLA
jgi:hypothetical protein